MGVIASPPSSSQQTSIQLTDWVLYDPTGNTSVTLKDVTNFRLQEVENIQWFEPIGSNLAISVAGQIMGAKIDLTLEFYNDTDYTTVRTMRRLQRSLQLRNPYGQSWYVRFNESWNAELHPGAGPYRTLTTSFTEVAKP